MQATLDTPLRITPYSQAHHDAIHADIWTRVLADSIVHGQDLGNGLTVVSKASWQPCFAQEILGASLYSDNGIFKTIVPMPDLPRISAVVFHDGVPVAHALLHPIWVDGDVADPHPGVAVIGMLGVYVRPDLRGQGLARRAAAGIGAHLAPFVRPGMGLVCETRVLSLFSAAMPCPVLPRFCYDRIDHAEALDRRDRAVVFQHARQETAWARILASGAVKTHAGGVVSQASAHPLWAKDIAASGLAGMYGDMPHRLLARQAPRVSAVAFDGPNVVAHAVLMPTAAYGCDGTEVHSWMGPKLGLIDARHIHGAGDAARSCLEAVSTHLGRLGQGTRPFCLTAEPEWIRTTREIFPLRVVARWRRDRVPGEYMFRH